MTTAYVTHPDYVIHNIPGHPERPARMIATWHLLEESGIADKLLRLEPQPATDEQILTVHTQQYLDVLNLCAMQDRPMRFDADTAALPETPAVARLAAGGVIRAVEAVCKGEADNGLAVVRPPGHHAIPGRAMGFCFLGNIAMAARYAQQAHGIQRVMILDYDVHHGNGTQDMFYDDDSVLFISSHQYPFYPGTGDIDETGRGKGTGYTLNIPMTAGCGDDEYKQVFEQVVWAAARRFKPELILVSAGFDAHWNDPLAMMNLSLTGYSHLDRELICMADELCGGKIVFVTEGGYDTQVFSHGVLNIVHALRNDPTVSDPLGTVNSFQGVANLIHRLKAIHNL